MAVGLLVVMFAAAPSAAVTACNRCIDTGSEAGAELVVSSPNESRVGVTEAGMAQLLVDGTAATVLGQDKPICSFNNNATPETNDIFGEAVAAGEFNGDGFDDIAIGVPHEDLGSKADAGVVVVLLSNAATGELDSSMSLHQNTAGFPGVAEAGDRFGYSLSSQDFGADDGYDDLIIGVPYEDIGSISNAGLVHVVHGSATGPDAGNVETWHQDTAGVRGHAEAGDRFGYAVAGSDVGDESWGTLIVGVPYEDVGSITDAGIVQVIYSESAGLTADGDDLFHQDVSGMLGNAESGDRFGMTLAVGNFGSGYSDLAVGVPYEDRGSTQDAGIVHIINGDYNGLVVPGNSILKQGSGQIEGTGEADDHFGAAVAAVPDGSTDLLVVGAPGETLGGKSSAGVVHVRFAMAEDATGLVTIHQGKPGIKGKSETGDEFGYSIDYSDIDNDGTPDLVVGGPGEDSDAGQVWVFFGSGAGYSADDTTLRQGTAGFSGIRETGDRFGSVVLGSRR